MARFRAHPASRKDPSHRVRPPGGDEARARRPGQAGDIRLPRLHPYLRSPRRGGFLLSADVRRDRKRAKVREVKEEPRRRRRSPIPDQGRWLRRVVAGWYTYHAVPTNFDDPGTFQHHVGDAVGGARCTRPKPEGPHGVGERMRQDHDHWLPSPRILHPWPNHASPSNIQGGSRMPESRPSRSVRGAPRNGHPYRDGPQLPFRELQARPPCRCGSSAQN